MATSPAGGCCPDGPQADVGAYLGVLRRRWRLCLAVFLTVFAAGVMFATMSGPKAVPRASVFSAIGVVSLPAVDPSVAANGNALSLSSPVLRQVTGILAEPLVDQARLVSSSELTQLARLSLPEADRATAERSSVSSLYLDEGKRAIQVAVTGTDPEVARVYANATMSRYAEDRNAALSRARIRALTTISRTLLELEPTLVTVVRELDRDARTAVGDGRQIDDSGRSASTSLSDAAVALSSTAAASRLLDSLSDAPVTYSEATVSAAPSGEARVTPRRVQLALALIVAALSAVVIALVVDSLSPPRAS